MEVKYEQWVVPGHYYLSSIAQLIPRVREVPCTLYLERDTSLLCTVADAGESACAALKSIIIVRLWQCISEDSCPLSPQQRG